MAGLGSLFNSFKKSANETEEQQLTEIGGTNLDRFFVECVLASCNDFSLEKNIAKAKLLADKYSLKYSDGVEELYKRGLDGHTTIQIKKQEKELSDLRAAEQEEYKELNRYATLYGRDKKIAILTDRKNELLRKAASLEEGAQLLMRSTQQAEKDWAMLGGIADGLAGPGAGVATALNAQAQNAQIRAQNRANMMAAMPAYMSVTNSASGNRKNAAAIEKDIQLVKEKLLADTPASVVLEKLNTEKSEVTVSETGACRVEVTVKPKEKCFIFEDVPATIDGTIVAHIFEDDHEIGTANLVLPVNGVSTDTKLIGIAITNADKTKKHTLCFSADKLWMMEI